MNLIDATALVVALLFSVYWLLASVEFSLLSRVLINKEKATKLFTPIWEVTNVFLVFAFVGLTILYNNSLNLISNRLTPIIFVAVISMLVRGMLTLNTFYNQKDYVVSKLSLGLMTVTTFIIPMCFASSGILFLTGNMFWQSRIGIVCFITSALSLIGIGSAFVANNSKSIFSKQADVMTALWLLFLGSVLPLTIEHSVNNLDKKSIVALMSLSFLTLITMLAKFIGIIKLKLWPFCGTTALLSVPLLVWANRPYLVSGNLKLSDAYGAQSYGSVVFVGLAVMLIPLVIGATLYIKQLRAISD